MLNTRLAGNRARLNAIKIAESLCQGGEGAGTLTPSQGASVFLDSKSSTIAQRRLQRGATGNRGEETLRQGC